MADQSKELCVAAVQMESVNGKVADNLQHATGFAEEAAGRGAKLIVFPEFMPTGYVFTKAIWDGGEPKDGQTVRWLSNTSRTLGVWLGTSFLEAEGENFFNTFVLTGPDGKEAGRVRKQTPAAAEAYFFKGDPGKHVIDTDFGKVGVGICYENQFSFLPRLMHSHSVDILLMPHSAPMPTPSPLVRQKVLDAYAEVLRKLPEHYSKLLGVPVVLANKSGRFVSPVPGLPFYKQDSIFPGESAIANSDGSLLARLGRGEGIAVADVTLDPARKTGVIPDCPGRWSMHVPLEINIFRVAESMGRTWYHFSHERSRRAKEISSG